jgi:hypothetical protein
MIIFKIRNQICKFYSIRLHFTVSIELGFNTHDQMGENPTLQLDFFYKDESQTLKFYNYL